MGNDYKWFAIAMTILGVVAMLAPVLEKLIK